MGKITIFESLTLDGVMQAPGRPDEDRRGGFEHGGWGRGYNDPVMTHGLGAGPSPAAGPRNLPEVRGVEDAAGAGAVAELHAAQRRRRGDGGPPEGAARPGHRGF